MMYSSNVNVWGAHIYLSTNYLSNYLLIYIHTYIHTHTNVCVWLEFNSAGVTIGCDAHEKTSPTVGERSIPPPPLNYLSDKRPTLAAENL